MTDEHREAAGATRRMEDDPIVAEVRATRQALAAAGLVGFRFFPSDAMVGGAFGKTDLGSLFLESICNRERRL
jgi:hypothetical protein